MEKFSFDGFITTATLVGILGEVEKCRKTRLNLARVSAATRRSLWTRKTFFCFFPSKRIVVYETTSEH